MACPRGTIRFAFDATNPEALAWARTRAATLVTNVTEETKAAIRAVIARSFDEGIAPRDAAKLIRPLVGLTERDAMAVVNARFRWLEEGRSPDEVARRAERYAGKLHRRRALTIARTETMAASNNGQLNLWKQAVDAGHLSRGMHKIWIVADPCDECEDYADTTAPMEAPFPNGLDSPPAHPNCRCVMGLVDDPTPKVLAFDRDDLGRATALRDLSAGVVIAFVRDAVGRLVQAVARKDRSET